MLKKSKKGFTIVELVIVIAVIGILSAILIPTFANLTTQAQQTALKSNLANAYSMYASDAADGYYGEAPSDPTTGTKLVFKEQSKIFLVNVGATDANDAAINGYLYSDNAWSINTTAKTTTTADVSTKVKLVVAGDVNKSTYGGFTVYYIVD